MLIILNEKECPIDANYCNEGKAIDSFIDAINTIVSDYRYCFVSCLYLLCLFGYNLSRILIVFHYSPIYYIILNNFQSIFLWIAQLLFEKSDTFSIITVFMNIIEIFGVFVALEIIIIKVCGMNKNVTWEITKRQAEEFNNKAEGLFSVK